MLENESADPMKGEFVMKGRISTDEDNNWAIHASTFEHGGKRYLIWCGWQKRRVYQENQCIYIAEMENPWTLASDRILISEPEYEWECQWISIDGNKTAYPIRVNEAPQFFYSLKKDKLLIYYSASGNWTPYYCVGLLTADTDSDLLNPASWKRHRSLCLSKHRKIMYMDPVVSALFLHLTVRNGICFITPVRVCMICLFWIAGRRVCRK